MDAVEGGTALDEMRAALRYSRSTRIRRKIASVEQALRNARVRATELAQQINNFVDDGSEDAARRCLALRCDRNAALNQAAELVAYRDRLKATEVF
jgi:hypothetical protein